MYHTRVLEPLKNLSRSVSSETISTKAGTSSNSLFELSQAQNATGLNECKEQVALVKEPDVPRRRTPLLAVLSRLWQLLRRALLRIRSEARSAGYLSNLVVSLLVDPKMYTKVRLSSMVGFMLGLEHEALTNDGTSCEHVAAQCLGEGRFSALKGRVAIITGASGGLGLENARCLMKYGCHVVWAVRNPEKAQHALKSLEEAEGGPFTGKATILKVDLSDLTTVKPFVQAFLQMKLPLHYLILNAGIMSPTEWEPSAQGYESMFSTNNLSHFLLTELLMPKMKQTAASGDSERILGAAMVGVQPGMGHRADVRCDPKADDVRIIILSSAAATCCSDIDPAKLPAPKDLYHEFADYAVSKACDAFHARQLQKQLQGTNISVTAVHPGIISTGLGQGNDGIVSFLYGSLLLGFARKGIPSGAATTMYCTLSDAVPSQIAQGRFYYYNRAPQRPMGIIARRDDLCESLYKRQMDLVRPFM